MTAYEQLKQSLLRSVNSPSAYDSNIDRNGLAVWRPTSKIVLKNKNVPAYVVTQALGQVQAEDTVKHKPKALEGLVGNLALSIHATDIARKLIRDATLRREQPANRYGSQRLQDKEATQSYIKTAINEYNKYLDQRLTNQGELK